MLSRIVACALLLCCGAVLLFCGALLHRPHLPHHVSRDSALRGSPEGRQRSDDVEAAVDLSNDTDPAFNDTGSPFDGADSAFDGTPTTTVQPDADGTPTTSDGTPTATVQPDADGTPTTSDGTPTTVQPDADGTPTTSDGTPSTSEAMDGMPPTVQPKSTDEAARASGERKRTMTLYHTTSLEIAVLILRTGFKPGHAGWCGGAIYFLDTPTLPVSKYGWHTQAGAVIEAVVDMGRMAVMGTMCNATFGVGMESAARHGYDSLRFNPGDGEEFVILSSDRVISMRLYK